MNNNNLENFVRLRLVEEKDADFILKLRQDENLNKYISPTMITLEEQKTWIKKYKEREKEKKEFYYIIEGTDSRSYGTVRIYNVDYNEGSATWGSFIIIPERPNGTAKSVIKASTDFIYNKLEINKILLDVRKENLKAIHIYEKYGFEKIGEDDLNFYYKLDKI